MEGDKEMVSPSKISFQSVGENGVTTSFLHPQAHKCTAVSYSVEI